MIRFSFSNYKLIAGAVVLAGTLHAMAPFAVSAGAEILTPPPSATPSINGAEVVGVKAGSPFLFKIPATGDQPMTFSAENLPEGLALDNTRGIITGVLTAKGAYDVHLHAANARGRSNRDLRIICGDTIALTPPMGWNSWNCFGRKINDADIRAAADLIVSTGLINHGWTYVNIDDGWAGERDAAGDIQGNKNFPDMKALCDYVHSKGLKIGIYSSPGAFTCAGFKGSLGHEAQDAQSYAKWGFDYLKYDWCSYAEIYKKDKPGREARMAPYVTMQKALAPIQRDIVYSLCQYGDEKVWEWGTSVNGNAWRTTGDMTDRWSGSDQGQGWAWSFIRIVDRQRGLAPYAGPGHWNDPDMMMVGTVGWGKAHASRLTPDEQYSHVSMWSLLAAPLLIGADLTKLDDFTLNLLENDDVIAVDQDALGKQGRFILKKDNVEIWTKELQGGAVAVGLFNFGEAPVNAVLNWEDIGIKGKQAVRDLWRQKDLGTQDAKFESAIAPHGVTLVRLNPVK